MDRRHIYRTTALIALIGLATLWMEKAGWLHGLESAALRIWFAIREPLQPQYVSIVGIREEDYRERFLGQSPLNPEMLRKLLKAIALGRPWLIGVNLETSDVPLDLTKDMTPLKEWPPIIWVRDADISEEGKVRKLFGVLGRTREVQPSGIGLFPLDQDGIVRSYCRFFLSDDPAYSGSRIGSFPWEVVKAACHHLAIDKCQKIRNNEDQETKVLLNFSDSYYLQPIPASDVLKLGETNGWQSQSPLKNRIVLVGGFYRAGRDEHVTPIGLMAGVQLAAFAIESELQNRGIHHAGMFVILLIDFMIGYVLVGLHTIFRYSRFREALLLSFINFCSVLILSGIGSYLAFSTLAYWVSFVPLLVGVSIHELHYQAERYREIDKELAILRTQK